MPVPTEPVIFAFKFQVPELLEEGQPRIEEALCDDFSQTWEDLVKLTQVEIDLTSLGIKSSQGKSEYELTQPVSDFFASIKGKRSRYSVFIYRKKAKRGRKSKTPKKLQNVSELNGDATPIDDDATPIKKPRGRPKVIKTIANEDSAVKSDEDPQNMSHVPAVAPPKKALKRKSVKPLDNNEGGETPAKRKRGRPPGPLNKAKKVRKSQSTASSSGAQSNTEDDDEEGGGNSGIKVLKSPGGSSPTINAADLKLMKGLKKITPMDCHRIIEEFNGEKRKQLSHQIPFTTSIICGIICD